MFSKSNEDTQHYFDYLKCNLNLINDINNRKKNLQKMNDQQQNKMSDLETKINSLQDQLNDSKNSSNNQQNKMNDLEIKINSLQNQLNDSVKANDKLQNQLNDSKSLNNVQQNKMKDLEYKINQLQNKLTSSEKYINDVNKQLKELFLIKGQIVASVENGILINAEIDLKTNGSDIDTSKSKVIISTNNARYLGSEAYEKGEPITSLNMKKSFGQKPGTYYVRCIVFNRNGGSDEIVSNEVTTSQNITEIPFSNGNLKGVFSYLKSHSNINNEVKVTRSSEFKGKVDILLDIERTESNWFSTQNEKNSWISFEFKKHTINPSYYTLKSIDVSPNDRHPKNWVIEGSLDGKEWEKLDEKNDCMLLNGNNRVHTFQISKPNEDESKNYYKYLRFHQTGPNCLGDYYIYICTIEFYGELI